MLDEQITDLTTRPDQTVRSKHEIIDLATAERVLQHIVAIHEATISENTPLDRIGTYSVEQVREAMRVFAASLIPGRFDTLNSSLWVKKQEGSLSAFLTLHEGVDQAGQHTGSASRLSLELLRGRTSVLSNGFSLDGAQDGFSRVFTGFVDYRGSRVRMASLSMIDKKPSLEQIREMWRGLRWAAVNMLGWKQPGFVMPEDLDKQSFVLLQRQSDK